MATKHPMNRRKPQGSLLSRLLVIAAAAVAVVIGVMIFFKVQTVSVVGNVRYTTDQIIAASGIEAGENLMTLSKTAAAQSIHAQLPYVQEVRIDRSLPDTVLIEVIECEAVATVADETGELWLISAQTRVLERAADASQLDVDGLTLVQGGVAVAPQPGTPLQLQQEEQTTALEQLLGALEQTALLSGVRSVQIERTYELTLNYENRFEVQLGGTDELYYKARYLEEIVLHQLEPTKTGIIDLKLEEDGVARLISD